MPCPARDPRPPPALRRGARRIGATGAGRHDRRLAHPSFFDVNKYRADPNNPGAIHIPGTTVAIYIGGFQIPGLHGADAPARLLAPTITADSAASASAIAAAPPNSERKPRPA